MPDAPSDPPASLLVATVGTPSCQRAEDVAIERAREEDRRVVFVYVADPGFLKSAARTVRGLDDVEVELGRFGRHILDRAARKAGEAEVAHDTLLLRGGPVWERIAEAATRHRATRIYLGRSKFALLLRHFKDVDTERLEERTGIPVTIVE